MVVFIRDRIDLLLVEKGFEASRERAKALVMAGKVYADNQKIDKPGQEVDTDALIEIRGQSIAFVSRGGLKLEKAINTFNIDLKDKICMDIGASTGGFTDCMLQNGAANVYSVDVGYGQLAWKLRVDTRVINLERTNVRFLTEKQVPDKIDFASVDVSFISLTLVLPVVKLFLKQNAEMVCLIKPQFEAGKGKVGKKGVVREPEIHIEVIQKICEFVIQAGFTILNLSFSPVKGPEGNIEYLIHLKNAQSESGFDIDIKEIVLSSHNVLKNKN
jgi:23S rRNA (cytidine1920-2'-O)/16S rRNA (cytidine1409-2'-O)-methyltransferase